MSSVPIIVASNLGQEEDRQRARKWGAQDYFCKSKHQHGRYSPDNKKHISK